MASNSFVPTRNRAIEGCLPKNGGTLRVAPSMLILTNNGGTIANLILCNDNTGPETVPVGFVFHWRVIGP